MVSYTVTVTYSVPAGRLGDLLEEIASNSFSAFVEKAKRFDDSTSPHNVKDITSEVDRLYVKERELFKEIAVLAAEAHADHE